jgi:hypothetical protein
MPVFTFQSAGPANLDSVGQRATPSNGPRISWGPQAFPDDGVYSIGDLHIDNLTGNVYVCTTAGITDDTAVFALVGTQA